MPRSKSTSRGGGIRSNGSQKPVSNTTKSSLYSIIASKDITPKSDSSSFIGCLWVLAAMVVMYFMEIFNCGPWLFGVAVAITWFNVPQKVEKKYRYDFEVSVGSNSYKLYGVSSLPTINVADIVATFCIDIDKNPGVTDLIYTNERIEVILTGGLTGSCLLDLECFDNTNGYNNQNTIYEIQGNITIKSDCGNFQFTIQKDTVPEIKWFCAGTRD